MSKDFNHSIKIIGLAIVTLILAGLIILFAPRASLAPVSEHPYDTPSPENPAPVSPILLDNLSLGATVTPGQVVYGRAPGTWFFEASMPVTLKDASGNIFAQFPATTAEDWMVTTSVSFSFTLPTPFMYHGSGTIMIQKDNPSGEPFTPGPNNTLIIPVIFQ